MRCGIGLLGGQRPSLPDYVTVTGPRIGRPPPDGARVAYALFSLDRTLGLNELIVDPKTALDLVDHVPYRGNTLDSR